MNNVLLVADHQVASTQRLITALQRLGSSVDVLLCHAHESVLQQISSVAGVHRVLHAPHMLYNGRIAEHEAAMVQSLAAQYNVIAAPASTAGKNLLPRVAALLNIAPITDVIDIIDAQTFVRPIYAGAVRQTVRNTQNKTLLTLRAAAFEPAALRTMPAPIDIIEPQQCGTPTAQLLQAAEAAGSRPDLSIARVVVSGGRGFGSAENFTLLNPLADSLGAAIGATRAAVDAGYIGNAHQVGQTGKIVSPALYLAIGLSGAVQHKAGMKESGTVVAINTDPQAPIMQEADFTWQTDLFTAIPQLLTALQHKDTTS